MTRLFIKPIAAILLCVGTIVGCSDGAQTNSSSSAQTSPPAPAVPEIRITKWGPESTKSGQGFNVQADGQSAMWFEASGVGGASTYEVKFGETLLTNVVIQQGKGGSVLVPKSAIEKPGTYQVTLIEKPSGRTFELGMFTVSAN